MRFLHERPLPFGRRKRAAPYRFLTGRFDQALYLGTAQQQIGLGIANFFHLIMPALSGLVELVGQIIKIRGFE